MWRDFLTWAGSGGVAALVSVLTLRLTRQGQRATREVEQAKNTTENRKVDLDSLVRTVERLDGEVERLSGDVAEERQARQAAERETADERIARKAAEQRAERAEQKSDRLAIALAAHGQWDLLVLAEVRKITPDFPEPPPIAVTDEP